MTGQGEAIGNVVRAVTEAAAAGVAALVTAAHVVSFDDVAVEVDYATGANGIGGDTARIRVSVAGTPT